MPVDINALRNRANELNDRVKQSFDQSNNSYEEEGYWKPTERKDGSGSAIIRFLPHYDSEEPLYVQIFNHSFKGKGGYYIETCPTTINKPCPVCEENIKLWDLGTDEAQNLARSRKRRKSYVANILVVKDPDAPENEGKVFLFKFGPEIFNKLKSAFEGDEALGIEGINPFDPFDGGANFLLNFSKKTNGFRSYERSTFGQKGQVLPNDQLAEVMEETRRLSEIIAPEKFKSYEELEKRMRKVLGLGGQASAPAEFAKPDLKEAKPNLEKELDDSVPFDVDDSSIDDILNDL